MSDITEDLLNELKQLHNCPGASQRVRRHMPDEVLDRLVELGLVEKYGRGRSAGLLVTENGKRAIAQSMANDGHVLFFALDGEVILEIDHEARILHRGVECKTPEAVELALRGWLKEAGVEEAPETDSAGDIAFGVPSNHHAVRLRADGRIEALGRACSTTGETYRRLEKWLSACRVTLMSNATRESIKEDGLLWHFVGGRGTATHKGGNINFYSYQRQEV